MSPTPSPQSLQAVHLDVLASFLPFALGMVSGLVAPSVIEWIKDALGARRRWEDRRNEIISTVRLVMGVLGAFESIRQQAFPDLTNANRTGRTEVSKTDFERLKRVDLKILSDNIPKLSVLTPKESTKSQADQGFVKYLLTVLSYFQALQAIVPIPVESGSEKRSELELSHQDAKLVKESDYQFRMCGFVADYYANKLGIDDLSLILDPEFDSLISRIYEKDAEEGAKLVKQAFERADETREKWEKYKNSHPDSFDL
jgi:hypothetical protein